MHRLAQPHRARPRLRDRAHAATILVDMATDGGMAAGVTRLPDGRRPGDAIDGIVHGYEGPAWARLALKATHPDTGGNPAAFRLVQAAREYLGI